MENYINMYWSLKHAWQVHKRKMRKAFKPYVTYAAFRHRVKIKWWTLEKAVNTPADSRMIRRLNWYQKIIYKIKLILWR